MALEIKIGGTTYRGTTDYSIKQQGGAVSTTSLNVLLETHAVPIVLQVAQVYLDGTLFFSGLIQSVSTPEYSSTYETKVFSIDVSSLECLMNHRLVTKNFYYYTYTSWTQVIQYIFDNYISQEGITLGAISTTAATFDSKYSVKDKKVYDVLSEIADAIGNASWWISPDRKFYFKIATDFTSVVAPTHLTKLKLSEKIGDMRTVEKMTGASAGITATEINATLLATLAARTGGSGKIEIAESDSDIHSDTKAATEASARLANYAESEKTITCTCHDLAKSTPYNSWPLSLSINGVAISGDFVVTERTISDHGPDAFSIAVTLKNNNYFARYGYSLKRVAVLANDATSSLSDIAADNKLTASEKKDELPKWNAVVSEKAGYDSEADAHSVSRVAYDAALQALGTYLNGGTAWVSGDPLWFAGEHFTETTDIDGDTYDAAWQAYYDARSNLEVAIRNAIQADAEAAQSAADAAAAIANSASKSWTQSSAPTIGTRPNAINGDTWYDSDDSSKYSAISGVWVLQTSDVPLDPAAYYSMDEVPEIPDDPAGIVYKNDDAWAGWARGGSGIISISNGIISSIGNCYLAKNITIGGNIHVRVKARQLTGALSNLVSDIIATDGPHCSTFIGALSRDWQIFDIIVPWAGSVLANLYRLNYGSVSAQVDTAFFYAGTGAYLPGSVLDNSGHGNHGQAFAVTPVAGISGNGLAFNAVNGSYCTIPQTIVGDSDRSVCFWARINGISDGGLINLGSKSTNNSFGLSAQHSGSDNYIKFYSWGGTNDFTFNASIKDDIFKFIVVTYQSKHFVLYIDGVLVDTHDISNALNTQGSGSLSGLVPMEEVLDEITVFSRVLSPQEVLGLYQSKSLPKVYTRAQYLADSAASDGVITPAEKYNILVLWYQIGKDTASGSYGTARARAISLGVSYSALESAWNALYTYLWTTPGVLVATSWDSNIAASKTALANLQAAYFAAELAQTNLNATTDAQTKANAVPKYLGRFVGAHAPTSNFGDWWLVIDTDDSPQRGCYYNNAGTPTRISAVSGETGYTTDALLLAKMQATMNDVAWAEKNGYGVASNYGIAIYFESFAACTAFIEKLFTQAIILLSGGTIASSNYVAGTSGFKLNGDTGIIEAISASLVNCTVSGKASLSELVIADVTAGDNIIKKLTKYSSTVNTHYTLVKYFDIPISGRVRIKYFLGCSSASGTVHAKTYLNDTICDVERSVTGFGIIIKFDQDVVSGDIFKLYIYSNSGGAISAYCDSLEMSISGKSGILPFLGSSYEL